jgi:hypothetical protein
LLACISIFGNLKLKPNTVVFGCKTAETPNVTKIMAEETMNVTKFTAEETPNLTKMTAEASNWKDKRSVSSGPATFTTFDHVQLMRQYVRAFQIP